MNQAFHTRFQFNKYAVVRQIDNATFHNGMEGIFVLDRFPGVGSQLLEAQGHPLLVPVKRKDLHPDLFSLREMIGRPRDPSPGYIRYVKKAVNAAQIDE